MKKILMSSIALFTLFSGFNNVKAEVNYTIYNVGDSITLVDGTKWHVISYSGSDSNELTIFSDYFVKTDGTQYQSWDLGWNDDAGFSINHEYFGKFDDDSRNNSNNTFCQVDSSKDNEPYGGCNAYSKVDGTLTNGDMSGTVSEDSYIKKYVDTKFLPNFINNLNNNKGLTSTISARLITIEEVSSIEQLNLSEKNVLNIEQCIENAKIKSLAKLNTDWLKSYNNNKFSPISGYYTMSPVLIETNGNMEKTNSSYVYAIAGDNIYATESLQGEFFMSVTGIIGNSIGVRPVVTLNKANVLGSKEYEELNNNTDNNQTTTTVVNNNSTTTIENPKTADKSNQLYIVIGVIALAGVTGLGVKLVTSKE